jgi:hypothetical protein
MMNTTTLKRAARDAMTRAAGASTMMMAFAAGPDASCSTRESTVLVRDGIGDPCIPEDERFPAFSGYTLSEVNVDTNTAACKTRMCLANHFQGRVTCPSGQTADEIAAGAGVCTVFNSEGGVEAVSVPVPPQCQNRPAADAVYCTCSCAGDNPSLDYCACPEGYTCQRILAAGSRLGDPTLGNSFCIRDGTAFNEQTSCQ